MKIEAAASRCKRLANSGWIAAVVWVCVLNPAQAGDPLLALQEFGIAGTWSKDCGKDVSPANPRITYSVPHSGLATRQYRTNDKRHNQDSTLHDARAIADDKIRFRAMTNGWQDVIVVVKRIDRNHFTVAEATEVSGRKFIEDGVVLAQGSPSPVYERCRE